MRTQHSTYMDPWEPAVLARARIGEDPEDDEDDEEEDKDEDDDETGELDDEDGGSDGYSE